MQIQISEDWRSWFDKTSREQRDCRRSETKLGGFRSLAHLVFVQATLPSKVFVAHAYVDCRFRYYLPLFGIACLLGSWKTADCTGY